MRWLLLLAAGCGGTPPDGWWQNDEADPYVGGGETEGEGDFEDDGELEAGFYGLLAAVGDGLEGERGVEAEGCLWYAGIAAEEVDLCGSDCERAVSVTHLDLDILEEGGCPDGFGPASTLDEPLVLGFAGEQTLRWVDGAWTPYAWYFEEAEFFGWYGEL